MIHKPTKSARPKKRLARTFDRDFAARLADVYDAHNPPSLIIGAKRVPFDGRQLARALRAFAEHGTWEGVPGFDPKSRLPEELRRLVWTKEIELRGDGVTVTRAIEEVAKRYDVSVETVRDAIYQKKGKRAPPR